MQVTITRPALVRVASIFTAPVGVGRYALAGVHFCKAEQGGLFIVSTDGHRMSVGHDQDARIEGEDSGTFYFTKEPLRRLTPRKGEALKLRITGDKAVLYSKNWDEHWAEVMTTYVGLVEGSYPDWRRIVSLVGTAGMSADGAFNPDYLGDYAKVRKALGLGDGAFTSFVGRAGKAHLVYMAGANDWFGVIMPCRDENEPGQPAFWGREVSPGGG